MLDNTMLLELMKYVLPQDIVAFFSLIDIKEEPCKDTSTLHLYLDGNNVLPAEYTNIELSPNGFYPESTIKDFPLRDRKAVLHIRRRRWKDACGKTYSRPWALTAEGTRYSHDFATFLKEAFGYQPDTDTIA
jgi:hypothetical protein